MKRVILEVCASIPLELREIDVDKSPELQERFGEQVPVLFIDGRKAFKFAVTARALKKQLSRKQSFGRWLARKAFSRT
jgi:hypothetical protein